MESEERDDQLKRNDRFTEVESRFPSFEVRDRDGEKIGTIQRLYADESGEPRYIAVKRDVLAMNVEIIPFDIATVDEANERIEVDAEKDHAENGPTFYEAQPITPDYERAVRSHYGL